MECKYCKGLNATIEDIAVTPLVLGATLQDLFRTIIVYRVYGSSGGTDCQGHGAVKLICSICIYIFHWVRKYVFMAPPYSC